MIRKKPLLGAAVIAGALIVGGAAFTASNTLPETSAGQGTAAITGYTVSDVVYQTADDTALIVGATFTVAPDTSGVNATTVQARVLLDGEPAGNYVRCTQPDAVGAPQDWACDWSPGYDPNGAVTLDVVALQ
jgi:hypothetical protein